MSTRDANLSNTLISLRRDFDQGFANPPAGTRIAAENLLAIQVGRDGYALRVSEISGLSADRRVVPLPSPQVALRGVAGFRGQLVPVYDLGLLLGYPSQQAQTRWLALLTQAGATVALAFEQFEGHFSIEAGQIASVGQEAATQRRHLAGAVADETGMRPLINLSSVLRDIQQRASQRGPTEEKIC